MKTNIKTGLTNKEIEDSKKKYGLNIIEGKKKRTLLIYWTISG